MTTVAAMVKGRAGDPQPGLREASGTRSWADIVHAAAARGSLAQSMRRDGPFHIGVLLPNVAEYHAWLCGAALVGAAVVGVNPTRRGAALAADIAATDCQLLVTDAEGVALLEGLALAVTPERILVTGTDEYRVALGAHEGDDTVGAVLDRAGDVTEDALFLLLFTSGTTGTPKAVRCTQGRLAAIAEVAAPGYGYTRDDVSYCPMPLFHGNALMALWGPVLLTGGTLALRPRFSASAFIDDVRAFGVTKFSYVGKAIAYILATPERPDDADNTLKSAFGTEASVVDRQRFRERFGCVLIEGYGSSEGGCAINPAIGMPAGALGKPPAGVDLAVLDPSSGEECPPAQFDTRGRILNAGEATGEIVNRSGRGSFEGYYGAPEAEDDRLRHGWYWTGDLAYRDADGWFYFAGRGGDWLRVDSENFAAGPVEAILGRHPDVSVSAVYPVPDGRTGDQVMAALELVPGATFDPDAFGRWLGQQPDLGTKWAPRYIRITPTLPQTATGKVTKVGLRHEAWATDDPVFVRPDRADDGYRPLTAADRAELAAELAAHGRGELMPS
jgi:fatty-acyl-CoA synthase